MSGEGRNLNTRGRSLSACLASRSGLMSTARGGRGRQGREGRGLLGPEAPSMVMRDPVLPSSLLARAQGAGAAHRAFSGARTPRNLPEE